MDLSELLISLFSADELRRVIRYFPGGNQLSAELPGPGASLAALTDSVVGLLERHGLTAEFIERIGEERPLRRQEIEAVAAQWHKESRSTVGWAFDTTQESSPPRRGRDDALFGSEWIFAAPSGFEPVQLGVWAASHDSEIRSQFESAIAPLIRVGIAAVAPDAAGFVDILCVLVTPELLEQLAADPVVFQRLADQATERSRPVLPIVVRPCLWQATILRDHTVVPRGDSSIATAANPDEAWRHVANTIAVLARQRSWAVPAAEDVSDAGGSTSASVTLPLYEVFTTGGMPPHTWVTTPHFHDVLQQLRRPSFGLIIEGPSGIGKTVTAKAALRELQARKLQSWPEPRWIHIYDETQVQDVEELLRRPPSELVGHIVIDDFHRLDATLRRRVGGYVRALVENGNPRAKITLIGINRAGEALIQQLPDLRQRAHTVAIGPQTDAMIERMVMQGEEKLNITFSHRAEIVVLSEGSFTLAQWMCELICQHAGVHETRPQRHTVDVSIEQINPRLLQGLHDQFHAALQEFVCIDIAAPTRGGPLAVLWTLSKSDENSAFLSDVRGQFAGIWPSFDALAKLLPGSVEAAWRQHIHFDAGTGQFSLKDPKLSFYLKYMNWRSFANVCGLRLVVTRESLAFVDIVSEPVARVMHTVAAREPEAAGEDLVRILHLSDFHFAEATAWDSGTCLGRLAVDIQRLRKTVGAPDLVVISGDIAFAGRTEEYAQMRAWLERELMPAAGVDASQIIVAPGNHDVDRSKTRSTAVRSTHAALLDSGKQEDVAALLAGEDADLMLRRHAAFVKFADSLQLGGVAWQRPWARFRRVIRGTSVHIAAFCSSWLSADDSDHGKLLLSLHQAHELLRDADSADLVISVMHHPFEYFNGADRAALAEVRRASGLVLRGHLHDPADTLVQGHAHDMVHEIAAGAAYESSEMPNAYHLLEAMPRAGRLRIRPRFWDTRRREWRADRNLFEGDVHEMPMRPTPHAKT
ncbi:metallophosphoesterase [Nannocystis sp. SCPEA4]|nr:metallophosphoesterase [Nannocystis sp. SCPEA4]